MTTAPPAPEPIACCRCGSSIETLQEAAGAMQWVAISPIMPKPCPPFITCEPCAIVLFAGFGVDAAKADAAARGLT